MGNRKFAIGDKVRVTKGDLYFHRGPVVGYDLPSRRYQVNISMIGIKSYRANCLELAELARQKHSH